MLESGFRSTFCLLLVLPFGLPGLAAQRRGDLPRPDSSRAPLLTRASADSIRYQTAYLHVIELLQALQAGDAATMSALLQNATLRPSPCGSVEEAMSRVATRARRIARADGGSALALFFDKIAVADSGATQVVTADVVLVPAISGPPVRTLVTLVLDPKRGVWTREAGLLEGLCRL